MKISTLILVLATLSLGGLPPTGEASPSILPLDPAASRLGSEDISDLAGLVSQLERDWSSGDLDSLWSRMDRGRGRQLWTVLHRDSLRYGDAFRAAMADSGRYDDFQQSVWEALAPRVHGLLEFSPRRASLVRSGSGRSRIVFLGEARPMSQVENLERHADHPFLGEILILSLLTPLDWSDPLFDPCRGAADSIAPLPWVSFCPAANTGLPLFDTRMDEAAIDARLDSLFHADPVLKSLGWLKKRIAKKAMKSAMNEIRLLTSAWDEYLRQKDAGRVAPGAPACPLPGKAVLRLVFLRENSFSGQWRLALCQPSELQDGSSYTLFLEPGFDAWFTQFRKWRDENG